MRKWGADVWVFWAHSFKNTVKKKRETEPPENKPQSCLKTEHSLVFPKLKGLRDAENRGWATNWRQQAHARQHQSHYAYTHVRTHTLIYIKNSVKKIGGPRMFLSAEFTQSFKQPQSNKEALHTHSPQYWLYYKGARLCETVLHYSLVITANEKMFISFIYFRFVSAL